MKTHKNRFLPFLLGCVATFGIISSAYGETRAPRSLQEILSRASASAISSLGTPLADYPNGCPDGFPLDCGNDRCCPADHTLFCTALADSPCFNPKNLTDEQLKTLSDECKPLLSCK